MYKQRSYTVSVALVLGSKIHRFVDNSLTQPEKEVTKDNNK